MCGINNENVLAPEIRCDDKNIISIIENNKVFNYIKKPDSRYNNDQWIKYIPLSVLYHYYKKNTYYNIYDIYDYNDNKTALNDNNIKKNNKKYIKKINNIISYDSNESHNCIYIRGYILLNIQAYDYFNIENGELDRIKSNNILINNNNNNYCCRDHEKCENNDGACYCDKIYDKKALKLAIDVGIKYSRSINKYKIIRKLLLNKICKDIVDYVLLKFLYDDNIINMLKNDNLSDITPYLKYYKKIKNKKLREEMILNDFNWNIKYYNNQSNYIVKNLSYLTTATIGFPIELDKQYDKCIIVFNYNKDFYTDFIYLHLDLFKNIFPFKSDRIYSDLTDDYDFFGQEIEDINDIFDD